MYDLAAFGSSYREVYLHLDPSDFARLDAAYKELEDAGLLEKTEQVGRVGKQFLYHYQLAPGAAVPAGASR